VTRAISTSTLLRTDRRVIRYFTDLQDTVLLYVTNSTVIDCRGAHMETFKQTVYGAGGEFPAWSLVLYHTINSLCFFVVYNTVTTIDIFCLHGGPGSAWGLHQDSRQ